MYPNGSFLSILKISTLELIYVLQNSVRKYMKISMYNTWNYNHIQINITCFTNHIWLYILCQEFRKSWKSYITSIIHFFCYMYIFHIKTMFFFKYCEGIYGFIYINEALKDGELYKVCLFIWSLFCLHVVFFLLM